MKSRYVGILLFSYFTRISLIFISSFLSFVYFLMPLIPAFFSFPFFILLSLILAFFSFPLLFPSFSYSRFLFISLGSALSSLFSLYHFLCLFPYFILFSLPFPRLSFHHSSSYSRFLLLSLVSSLSFLFSFSFPYFSYSHFLFLSFRFIIIPLILAFFSSPFVYFLKPLILASSPSPPPEMSLPEEDLSLLASCNHSIMTAGSFGFWASYLAGGEVLYSLLRGCVFTPFVHPGSVTGEGFERWRGL